MSKKNFKGINPALRYISALDADTDIPHDQNNTDNAYDTDTKHSAHTNYNTDIRDNAHNADTPHSIDAAHYVYNTDIIHSTEDTHKTRKAHNNHNTEVKSRRLNLLLQPSILKKLSKIARMKQTSVNNLINRVLGDYTEREAATVARYDDVFGESSENIL